MPHRYCKATNAKRATRWQCVTTNIYHDHHQDVTCSASTVVALRPNRTSRSVTSACLCQSHHRAPHCTAHIKKLLCFSFRIIFLYYSLDLFIFIHVKQFIGWIRFLLDSWSHSEQQVVNHVTSWYQSRISLDVWLFDSWSLNFIVYYPVL